MAEYVDIKKEETTVLVTTGHQPQTTSEKMSVWKLTEHGSLTS